MTPQEFFASWYVPQRLHDSPPATVESYRTTLGLWASVFGAMPLEDVKAWHLERFRTILTARPGRRGQASPNTVRRHLRHLQSVLDAAGPQQRRRDVCAGILAEVPYVRPPRPLYRDPVPAAIADVWAVYECAELAHLPQIEGLSPGAWWRAAISVCLSTALRYSQLTRLETSSVDFTERRLLAPAEVSRKSRRDAWLPLAPRAVADLLAIRGERPLLLPQPHAKTAIYKQLRQLQAAAGIPAARRWGFHGLRRLVLTEVCQANAIAATQLAGHARIETTARHYIPREQLRQTVENLSLWAAS